jgi:Cys-tRNA(Pro)/Cys-tRNA(Cys) deacylase
MRILDSAGIAYRQYTYDHTGGFVDGVTVAGRIGQPVEKVYKTLVAQGAGKSNYVFVIPVAKELNLKAAARAVGEKSVELIKVSDIEKITGYIRGGCSPIGMKKEYETMLDSTCQALDTIIVSAGKIGCQIELKPDDLIRIAHCRVESIAVDQ